MLIDRHLKFRLPHLWNDRVFETEKIGAINFLVGPNGSGKSLFAKSLLDHMRSQGLNTRFLGTDRLNEMTRSPEFERRFGRHFSEGFDKSHFSYLKTAGAEGSGIDTIVLLEERMDLRIQIEATLSHLFDRELLLEWDSGRLVPTVARRSGGLFYRLDREECHGIKELLVMLTHLYDDKNQYLIIDEPELNLHPQYQAFFMQEVRRVAGDPENNCRKKIVFFVTHSPFILDLRSEDDFKSVLSFDLEYSPPKQVASLPLNVPSLSSFAKRLNVHHKQFFFSDNPIFVEGILDAWLVEAMMETRGVSVAGAGSCIIDAGGAEEVNQYLKLCQGLGKTAHFLYDLDSLFRGNLRACIRDDETIRSFLANAGLGTDFGKYCGQLEQKLNKLADELLAATLPSSLEALGTFLRGLGPKNQWSEDKKWAKARTAIMTAVSLYREDMLTVATRQTVEDIEGHRTQIIKALREKNIRVLPGGTLERYLPNFTGDVYVPGQNAKHKAVLAEIEEMSYCMTEEQLVDRYGELYAVVSDLPSKAEVDVEPVLHNHLSRYVFELQMTVLKNPDWNVDQVRQRLSTVQSSWNGVFEIQEFDPDANGGFSATIGIIEMLGQQKRVVQVNNRTNAGEGNFQVETVPTAYEDGS